MQIVVQLSLETALQLQNVPPQKDDAEDTKVATTELLEKAKKLSFILQPMHPGQTHPLLAPYFVIEVGDIKTARRIMKQLTRLKAVKGVYLKPQAEIP